MLIENVLWVIGFNWLLSMKGRIRGGLVLRSFGYWSKVLVRINFYRWYRFFFWGSFGINKG